MGYFSANKNNIHFAKLIDNENMLSPISIITGGYSIGIDENDIFYEVDHTYPDITIHLTLFNSEIIEGEPKMLEHADIKWISPKETDNYKFCAADKDIIAKIKMSNEIIRRGEKVA